MRDKTQLRAVGLQRRTALRASERARATATANRLLFDLVGDLAAGAQRGVAGLYAPVAGEVDPGTCLNRLVRAGFQIVLPRVSGRHLDLVPTGDMSELVVGFRGVREPVGEPVDPQTVDVIVTPGVAFDDRGGRLGHGGGHYDRLLAALPAATPRVGFGFACQLVARVPMLGHDEPVDVIVTEDGTHRTGARELL